MTPFFTQNLIGTTADRVGVHGFGAPELAQQAPIVEQALTRLRVQAQEKTLELLECPNWVSDLAPLQTRADDIRAHAEHVVILGTGGSSLGGQTLAQLKDYGVVGHAFAEQKPQLHFLDNLDPVTLKRFLQNAPLKQMHFIAISKSGGTGETLLQVMAALQALNAARLPVAQHFSGLSEPRVAGRRNALRDLLEPAGVHFLEHPTGIGGRYSVLSGVGLLPAAILGLDVAQIRAGALEVVQNTLVQPLAQNAVAQGTLLNLAAMKKGQNIHVMMGYGDRFERLSKWWVQLWAESIGKQNSAGARFGSQPVAAVGSVDQHSQLQLYLAGPRDKLFTLLTTDQAERGITIDPELAARAHEPDFGNRKVGEFTTVQAQATLDTLIKNGCPTRHIHVSTLNEASFGALLMHFMLETILTGYALNVDPFDQPAVEEGKILAKAYLQKK
jgi:glucose-6-phosphate isomerase